MKRVEYRESARIVLIMVGCFAGCFAPWLAGSNGGSRLVAAEPESMFDGKTLDQWEGDPQWWKVEDGAIVGSTFEAMVPTNVCLVWKGDPVKDFRLTLQAKVDQPHNCAAVIYRGWVLDDQEWRCAGYRFPIEVASGYIGMLWGEQLNRGRIATRGQKVIVNPDTGWPVVVDKVSEITPIHIGKWHTYEIEARGNHLIHKIDGVVAIDAEDNHPKALSEGRIALQLHVRGPMRAWFKDLQLERLED